MELICGDDVRGTRITRREERLTTTRGDGEFSDDWRWFYGEWKSKEITLERFRNRGAIQISGKPKRQASAHNEDGHVRGRKNKGRANSRRR